MARLGLNVILQRWRTPNVVSTKDRAPIYKTGILSSTGLVSIRALLLCNGPARIMAGFITPIYYPIC